MSNRRKSLRILEKTFAQGAIPNNASHTRALRSALLSSADSPSLSPTPTKLTPISGSRTTYTHTRDAISESKIDSHLDPEIEEILSTASKRSHKPSPSPTIDPIPSIMPQTTSNNSDAPLESEAVATATDPHSPSTKHFDKTSTPAVSSPYPHHTSHVHDSHSPTEINNSSVPPEVVTQIELDIEKAVLDRNITSSPNPPNKPVTPLLTESTLSRLFDLETKFDTFIQVQELASKAYASNSKHLQDIDSRLDTIENGLQSIYTCIQDQPQYHQNFSKITKLFAHTIQSIESMEAQLTSIYDNVNTHQAHSSGISFASDSSDDLPRNVLNAKLATVSAKSKPPRTQPSSNPAPLSAHALHSTTPLDSTTINRSIVDILDKLVDSKDSKAPKYIAFPTFSGSPDSTSFHRWSTLVCGILSTAEWSKLYDTSTQSYITDGSAHPILNNHLYSALLLKLKGPALDYATSRRDLNGDGIGLLEALRKSFKSVLTPADLFELENKFRNHSRGKDQPIEQYVAEIQTMRKEIIDNGGHCPPDMLKHFFILNLGPDFSEIIRLNNTGTLPLEWKPLDLYELIPVAKKFLQSVLSVRRLNRAYKEAHKPPSSSTSSSNKKQTTEKPSTTTDAFKDRIKRIYTAIYYRRFDPKDFEHEVGKGCCVFHGTKDHTTGQCLAIQKALDKSNANPSSTPTPSNKPNVAQPTAKVASLPSETLPDSIQSQIEAVDFAALQGDEYSFNHSKDNVSPYITLSSRSISLTKHSPSPKDKLRLILDSGAFPHMSNCRYSFDSFHPWPASAKVQHVLLADGTSKAPIQGIGSILFSINDFAVRLHNVLYVPTLSTSLFSIKEHAQYQQCSVRIQDNRYFLTFPTYTIKKTIGEELSITVKLPHQCLDTIHFDSSTAQLASNSSHTSNESLFHHLTALRANTNPSHTIDIPPTTPDASPELNDTAPSTIDTLLPKKNSTPLVEDVVCDNPPSPTPPDHDHTHVTEMFPDPNDNEFNNNGHNISTFPPPYLSTNLRIHIKLPDSSSFQNGFLRKSQNHDLWNFYPGGSRNVRPLLLPTTMLSTLFSSGLIRKGHLPNSNKLKLTSTTDLPHWVLHEKITIQLPKEIFFRRGFILTKPDGISFVEGLHRTNVKHITHIDMDTLTNLYHSKLILKGHNHRLSEHTSQSTIPRLRPVDSILQSSPNKVTLTDTDLRQGFGFRNTTFISKKLHSFTTKTFSLTSSDSPEIIDLGSIATIDKSKRTTTPLTLPHNFGDLIHCDILYGSNTSIKGFRYALFLIDKATRFKFVYGLKSLQDILPVFKRFCADIGFVPAELRTDFHTKLMGHQMQSFMNHHGSVISSVPAGKQRSNGICKRSWRSLLRMSRSWLVSSLLPTKFWYHALKRAAEVSNYLPLTVNDTLTTPFELVYKTKPDLRNLLPMFSVSYVRRSRDANTNRLTFHSTSIRCICLGRDDVSNQLEFYHPPTRQLL